MKVKLYNSLTSSNPEPRGLQHYKSLFNYIVELQDSLEIVKISDFDINKEILNHIKTTTEELRSLIVLQHPNILAAKDKVFFI